MAPDSTNSEARERQHNGVRARQDAIQALIAAHREEFDGMVTKNRLSLGLPARASGPSREALEERIRKARERLEKWEAELKAGG
jgi:hypothetical protein